MKLLLRPEKHATEGCYRSKTGDDVIVDKQSTESLIPTQAAYPNSLKIDRTVIAV